MAELDFYKKNCCKMLLFFKLHSYLSIQNQKVKKTKKIFIPSSAPPRKWHYQMPIYLSIFECFICRKRSRSRSKDRSKSKSPERYGEGAIRVKDEPLDKVVKHFELLMSLNSWWTLIRELFTSLKSTRVAQSSSPIMFAQRVKANKFAKMHKIGNDRKKTRPRTNQ